MATRTTIAAAAAVAAFALSPTTQAQSLTGSQVTAAGYCCSAPIAADLVTNVLTRTVGSNVEFPQGSFTATTGFQTIPATIDIGSSTIEITYSAGGTASPGGFNGFAFTFADAPAITGVSLDPSSTYSPVLSFDANHVYVNEAGVTLSPGSRVLVNVAAVPEPEAYALM
ncbi:MAG: hypothetical protein ACXU8R_27595, partial [Xanthobacteraceae bacterium]